MLEHKSTERARDRRARMAQAKQDFLRRLESTLNTARKNLAKTQQRYKRNFDARVRARLKDIEPGSYVYREVPVHPEGVNPKLASPVDGPHRVIANEWPTIIIDDRGHSVQVNANRLVKAPVPLEAQPDESGIHPDHAQPQQGSETIDAHPREESDGPGETPVDEGPAPSSISTGDRESSAPTEPTEDSEPPSPLAHPDTHRQSVRPTADEPADTRKETRAEPQPDTTFRRQSRRKRVRDQRRYEIGGLVDAGVDDQGNELYKVRWAGYGPEDDTWEPSENLPHALIHEYKQAHGLG